MLLLWDKDAVFHSCVNWFNQFCKLFNQWKWNKVKIDKLANKDSFIDYNHILIKSIHYLLNKTAIVVYEKWHKT